MFYVMHMLHMWVGMYLVFEGVDRVHHRDLGTFKFNVIHNLTRIRSLACPGAFPFLFLLVLRGFSTSSYDLFLKGTLCSLVPNYLGSMRYSRDSSTFMLRVTTLKLECQN